MTDEELKREAADEAIEDLEAPAGAQGDVVGGKVICQTDQHLRARQHHQCGDVLPGADVQGNEVRLRPGHQRGHCLRGVGIGAMTDEQKREEGAEEAIEDLEAPAEAQQDVAGGAKCTPVTCTYSVLCLGGTCKFTKTTCEDHSGKIIVFDHEP